MCFLKAKKLILQSPSSLAMSECPNPVWNILRCSDPVNRHDHLEAPWPALCELRHLRG